MIDYQADEMLITDHETQIPPTSLYACASCNQQLFNNLQIKIHDLPTNGIGERASSVPKNDYAEAEHKPKRMGNLLGKNRFSMLKEVNLKELQ